MASDPPLSLPLPSPPPGTPFDAEAASAEAFAAAAGLPPAPRGLTQVRVLIAVFRKDGVG
jgi:hypothetical protein